VLYILYILHAVSLKDEEVVIGLDTYITCIDRSDLIEFGDNSVQNMRPVFSTASTNYQRQGISTVPMVLFCQVGSLREATGE
jgi:hypothetical protein